MQEQKELLELFSPQQLAVLKKMGAKKKEKKAEVSQINMTPPKNDAPLTSSEDIGKAVQDQYM